MIRDIGGVVTEPIPRHSNRDGQSVCVGMNCSTLMPLP
jgi:hypothetical protein